MADVQLKLYDLFARPTLPYAEKSLARLYKAQYKELKERYDEEKFLKKIEEKYGD